MRILKGSGTKARALRSTGATFVNIGGKNVLRLLSNLVLTRLLFPEAFGLMALTQVFIEGLRSLSDIGLNTMVIHRKEGVDRKFLDAIWTFQLARGALLWLLTCVIAWPMAQIYNQPMLAVLLPFVGLTALIDGCKPTREMLANRHLQIGRVVTLGLAVQTVGLIFMAILAYLLQSVWALAIGTVVTAAMRVIVMWVLLPGDPDRFGWDNKILREVVNFGAFIFLATVAHFFVQKGALLMLGGYLDTATFGVLSVATTFAGLALIVTNQAARVVVAPLYRMKPPYESKANQRNVFKARRLLALVSMTIATSLAVLSVWLIDILYDPRYALAGPMMLVIALATLSNSAVLGTREALLGCGDSKRFAVLSCTQAICQITFVYFGIIWFGLVGALMAQVLSIVVTYPLRAWLTAHYKAWDPLGELGLLSISCIIAVSVAWFHWDNLSKIFPL